NSTPPRSRPAPVELIPPARPEPLAQPSVELLEKPRDPPDGAGHDQPKHVEPAAQRSRRAQQRADVRIPDRLAEPQQLPAAQRSMVIAWQFDRIEAVVSPALAVVVFEPAAPMPERRVLVTEQVRMDAG